MQLTRQIIVLFLLLSTAALAADATIAQQNAKHEICQKHPPLLVSMHGMQMKWPEGFESCDASEKLWAQSEAKRLSDIEVDKAKLKSLDQQTDGKKP
jgi:hypothetical protein